MKSLLTLFALAISTIFATVKAQNNQWNYYGPPHDFFDGYPRLGLVRSVYTSDYSGDVMIAASNTAGMYRTNDGGINWESVTDDLGVPGLGITDISSDPANPSILYATSGSRSTDFGGTTLQLLKSINHGITWSSVEINTELEDYDIFHDEILSTVRVSPFDSDHIIVGGRGAIYVSVDGGDTWGSSNGLMFVEDSSNPNYVDDDVNWNVHDILFHPTVEGLVYAATKDYTNFQLYTGTTTNAMLLRSYDGGLNWEQVPLTGDGWPSNELTRGVVEIDFDVNGDLAVFAAYSDTAYISLGEPVNFEETQVVKGGIDLSRLGPFLSEFAMSKIEPNLCYAFSRIPYVIQIGENGLNEIPQNNGIHDDGRDILLVSSPDGQQEKLYSANDGGLSVTLRELGDLTSFGSLSWTSLNGEGLLLTQVHGGGQWSGKNGVLFGAQDNGTNYMTQYNIQHELPSDGSYASASDRYDSIASGGSQSSRDCIDLSSTPSSVSIFTHSLPGDFGWWKMLPFESKFLRHDESMVAYGFQGLKIAQFVPESCTFTSLEDVTFGTVPLNEKDAGGFDFSRSEPGRSIFSFRSPYWNSAATIRESGNAELVSPDSTLINRVFRTTDNWVTHEDITDNFFFINDVGQTIHPYAWNAVNEFAIDPHDADHILAGIWLRKPPENSPNNKMILESTDGGDTWHDLSDSLPEYGVNAIEFMEGADEMVFAGTSAGLFALNYDSAKWAPFGEGLPPCIVTSIDFDYCNRELVAFTYGKGVWRISYEGVITQNRTITESLHVKPREEYNVINDLIVEPGATVLIEGVMRFAPGHGMIIQPGGKVIVDGGLLAGDCHQSWRGVEVWGNPLLSQSPGNQGELVLKNGAFLEDAEIGVLAGHYDNGNLTLGGGIVRGTNSTIQNCQVGVKLAPYIYCNAGGVALNNQSTFKGMMFSRNAVHDNDLAFFAHAQLHHVIGVKFYGCMFIDELAENPEYAGLYQGGYHSMGYGIDAHSSGFLVDHWCSSTTGMGDPCPESDVIPSSFSGLNVGVAATDETGSRYFSVRHSGFTGNRIGVWESGQQNGCVIAENTFTIYPVVGGFDLLGASPVVGAHLRSTNGFELEGNQFLGEPMIGFGPPNQTTHGVIFDHLGPEANECYRNTFDNLDYGVYVVGKNGVGKAGTGGVFEGLQILCNEFGGTTDNLHDIYLAEGASIANAQGQPASGYSAGNEFSWLTGCQSGELTSDFTVLSSSPALSYYWNSGGGAQQEPLCYSEDKIASSEANGAPRTCESRIWPTRTKNMLLSEQSLMENLVDGAHDVYYNDVDNGDVPGLVSTIENPINTSEQVRNAMIACIPDLSDEAFKAAFERFPAMDEWHIAQVLLLNSPLKPSVLDMMSVYGLDPFYRERINGLGRHEL